MFLKLQVGQIELVSADAYSAHFTASGTLKVKVLYVEFGATTGAAVAAPASRPWAVPEVRAGAGALGAPAVPRAVPTLEAPVAAPA